MRILFFGDIVGKPGRKGISRILPELIARYEIELVGANVENAAGGFGITREVYQQLLEIGLDFMSSGNHIWDKKELAQALNEFDRLVRPANYSEKAPGTGSILLKTNQAPIAVLNLAGRVFMEPAENPFLVVDQILQEIPQEIKIILVDFHAEATSEKVAMGLYLDGRVSAVLGTHTHIQTADERILPKGTAYITDTGMCGPRDSVIGIRYDQVLEKFITGIPHRFEVASGPILINAVVLDLDPKTGKANSIERINRILES